MSKSALLQVERCNAVTVVSSLSYLIVVKQWFPYTVVKMNKPKLFPQRFVAIVFKIYSIRK